MKTAMLAWYSCRYEIVDQKKGMPRWRRAPSRITKKEDADYIRKCHFVSDKVNDVLENGPHVPIRLEHCIPQKVVDKHLRKRNPKTTDQLRSFLDDFVTIGFVTVDEDNKLNENYKDSMPEDWDGKNIFARYEAVEIKGQKLRCGPS